MIAIKGMEMPKNCVECDNMALRYSLGCELIFKGCANCGRHPDCPLVEIVTCKDCTYDGCAKAHSPNHWCADGERRE